MYLTVTQENIDAGVHANCGKCPIALALHQHFERHGPGWEIHSVRVRTRHAFVAFKDGTITAYSLPSKATDFILNFDAIGASAVKPFSFSMEAF